MNATLHPDASLTRLLALLEAHNPQLFALLSAESEEAFMEATEGGIERAIRTIEEGAKRYSKLDERGLSRLLADMLSLAGWQATAERDVNGHVDVVIEHSFGGRWKYLGECKIYRGYQYHIDGCEQVMGYCTGREQRAFCLDFFSVAGMYEKLKAMSNEMDEKRPLSQSAPSIAHRIEGAFLTSHPHASGRSLELLHLGCAVPPS